MATREKKRKGFALVFCVSSNPTDVELAVEERESLDCRFRNGRYFDPMQFELQSMPGEPIVKRVYTNNSVIRDAYLALNGTIRNGRRVEIEVLPIVGADESSGPTEDDLMKLTVSELVDTYGVEPKAANGRRRKKSDLVAEILAPFDGGSEGDEE